MVDNATCPRCGGLTSWAYYSGTADVMPYRCNCPPIGWQCPACGRVWAPGVRECEPCNARAGDGEPASTDEFVNDWDRRYGEFMKSMAGEREEA